MKKTILNFSLVILIFVFFLMFFTACSQSNRQSNPGNFFDDVLSVLSNAWNSVVQFFKNLGPNLAKILNNIMSGLSGIGDGLRNMFSSFFD